MTTRTTSQDSPPPPTTEEDLADLPGFAQPPPRPGAPDLLDPTMTTTEPGPLDEGSWAGADEEGPRPGSAARGTGSSKASTDWRDLVPITSTLVAMTSLLVRWVRGRRRELADGVWVADEDDAAMIAAPLARIAARRSPISGEGSADVVDGLEVMVGATGYALKNLEREAATSTPLIVDEPQ